MQAFDTSYAFDVTKDATTGAPNGVANVEQSFSQAMINNLMSPFKGGTVGAIGAGNTAGEVVKAVLTHTALDMVEDKFGISANVTRLGRV